MAAPVWGAGRYLTEDEALSLAFPGAEFKKDLAIATDVQREEIGRILNKETARIPRFFRYQEAKVDGRFEGYAVVGDVIGKHKPITYLIAFTPEQKVKSIEILVYREAYGHEIRQENFRQQFHGKDVDDPLRLNREIRNISGATISCRSIIEAVRENLALLKVLVPARAAESGTSSEAQADLDLRADSPTPDDAGGFIMRRRMRVLMGTTLEVTAYAGSNQAADRAINAAFDEVERIENLLSTYREETVISQLNAGEAGLPVRVGAETFGLLRRSQDFTLDSGGRLDISVGPLVTLWREAERRNVMPDETELAAALERVGPDVLQLLPDDSAALTVSGARLDLGAIGKGYALDRAGDVLRANSVHRAMLNFGGQILALDAPPGEAGWLAHVKRPGSEDLLAQVLLANESLATSADTERGLRIAGRTFSHIIDPRTGYPVEGALSASVIAPNAEFTDAWATSLFASGAAAARDTAREFGLNVLLVSRAGDVIKEGNRFEFLDSGAEFLEAAALSGFLSE